MSNMMYNNTQTNTGFAPLDAKSSRPEFSTGFSGRDDVGDVRSADQQFGAGHQEMANSNNIRLVGPGEQNLQGLQGPGTSQEFLDQAHSGDRKEWSQASDKWGPNSQQWATQHDDVAGQAPIEPHHERMPQMDFGTKPTSEILGLQRDQPVGDAANLGGAQPSLAEAQPFLGTAQTDLGVGSGQLGTRSEIPVVTTTQTVTEIREFSVPLETEKFMPTEQFPTRTEQHIPLIEKELPIERHVPVIEKELPIEQHIHVVEKQLPLEQQIPVAPVLAEVPLAAPVHANADVFQEAAKKAEDYHVRVENRERDKMLIHESRELEHKKLEHQHKKEEWKHEKSHKQHLADQELHASLAQHHSQEMQRQHEKHIKEQEKLHRLVVQHTEEMKEAHEAHLKKLDALKNLVLQHTQDMKIEQQEHLAEQQRHHDLIKSHSEQVEKHKLEAEKEMMEAQVAREKKQQEELLREAEKERKEEHREVKEEARVMPGGSGLMGGLKDAAHKAAVAIGL